MAGRARNADVLCNNALGFRVSEPLEIALDEDRGGKGLSDRAIKHIVMHHKAYTSCYGCYVYSVRVGRGIFPIYVGSAVKQTLGKEAFNSRNLRKCERYIRQYKHVSCSITFIAPKDKVDPNTNTRRGRCPEKTIQKLEKVLTALAFRKNRNLINSQNLGLQEFFIPGAINTNAGRPTTAVSEFKDMMGLGNKSVVVVNTRVKKKGQDVQKRNASHQ